MMANLTLGLVVILLRRPRCLCDGGIPTGKSLDIPRNAIF
jgi:hypothetical protein